MNALTMQEQKQPLKLFLNESQTIGSTIKLKKDNYCEDVEPTEFNKELKFGFETSLGKKELREFKGFVKLCKKLGHDSLTFKTSNQFNEQRFEIFGLGDGINNGNVSIEFVINGSLVEQEAKYSVELLLRVLDSFKLSEIEEFSLSFQAEGVLKIGVNGSLTLIAPRVDVE